MALIPAAIWLSVIFNRTKRRGLQILLFLGSIFSVVPVFLLQYLLNLFPQFDVLLFLQANITNQNLNLLLLFVSVGIVEEIVKQALVRYVDKHYLLIQTINESIQFSLVAALGFSFAENIFYIFSIYTQLGIKQLFVAYLFRSVFTTCAHMIFSGFFGYYYGIAKFSLNIVEQKRMSGNKGRINMWFANLFNMSSFEAYKQLTILKGAATAIMLHAVFNLLLQFNQIIPVVLYVLAGYMTLRYLLKSRTGRLILVSNVSQGKDSTMAQKDEEVVIELLGMWFKGKRFVDVIHICQRILQRDPGNRVVELFKARAIDKLGKKDAYGKILQNLFPGKAPKSLAAIAKEKGLPQITKTATPPKPITEQGFETLKPQTPKKSGEDDKGVYELKL